MEAQQLAKIYQLLQEAETTSGSKMTMDDLKKQMAMYRA